MKKILISAAVLSLTLSGAAFAGAAQQARASTKGLDLTRANDARAMLVRLDNAALEACGASTFSLREVKEATRGSECHQVALKSAVQALGAPMVTSLYQGEATRFAGL